MTRRITVDELEADPTLLRTDTEIVGSDGRVIAYRPPPIKPVPMSWRERLARRLVRIAGRVHPYTEIDLDSLDWTT